jgi:SYP6 family syntaxin
MDPYYAVKLELDDLLHDLKQKMARYHGLQANNPERKVLLVHVEAGCESAHMQLDLLMTAVEKASESPERFNLTSEELGGRRRWIEKGRREVETVREATKSAASAPPPPLPVSTSAQMVDANNDFIGGEKFQQMLITRQQDRQLGDIEAAVGRIGRMGRAIGEEMEDQERLLGDLNEDVDVTNTRLRVTQKRMQDVIRSSSVKQQLCLIVFLVVVLIILIVIAAM